MIKKMFINRHYARYDAIIRVIAFYAVAVALTICCGCRNVLVDAFETSREARVSFNTNGGIPAHIDPETTYGGTMTASFPSNPIKVGYTFAGWFNGNKEYTSSTAIAKDITLTARWRAISIDVVTGNFADSRNGQTYTYKTVKIGNQTWMAENLNYKTDSSWCYNNADSNCTKYGRLYTWNAAKMACPDSWHLPTNVEWNTLIQTVGGSHNDAGNQLKSIDGWTWGGGSDNYRFSALPGGYRYRGYSGGSFSNAGYYGYWWSATGYNDINAFYREMVRNYVSEGNNNKSYGYSVRCVQDL